MLQSPVAVALAEAEVDWSSPRPPEWIMGGAWGSQRTILFSGETNAEQCQTKWHVRAFCSARLLLMWPYLWRQLWGNVRQPANHPGVCAICVRCTLVDDSRLIGKGPGPDHSDRELPGTQGTCVLQQQSHAYTRIWSAEELLVCVQLTASLSRHAQGAFLQ